tara:strand:+ start:206 stop:709 length:504 start_codon:yes stop_codon:yes gene_type:complete
MKNKTVGVVIIILTILLTILVFSFRAYYVESELQRVIDTSGGVCEHTGEGCPHEEINKINPIVYTSIAVLVLLLLIGIYLIVPKKQKVIIKKIKQRKKRISLKGLNNEEKKVIGLLQEESGAIFQRTLMEKLEIGKVKMTRILDKLEAKQLIERKRRGMNNIIVLKN